MIFANGLPACLRFIVKDPDKGGRPLKPTVATSLANESTARGKLQRTWERATRAKPHDRDPTSIP